MVAVWPVGSAIRQPFAGHRDCLAGWSWLEKLHWKAYQALLLLDRCSCVGGIQFGDHPVKRLMLDQGADLVRIECFVPSTLKDSVGKNAFPNILQVSSMGDDYIRRADLRSCYRTNLCTTKYKCRSDGFPANRQLHFVTNG